MLLVIPAHAMLHTCAATANTFAGSIAAAIIPLSALRCTRCRYGYTYCSASVAAANTATAGTATAHIATARTATARTATVHALLLSVLLLHALLLPVLLLHVLLLPVLLLHVLLLRRNKRTCSCTPLDGVAVAVAAAARGTAP
jgi:hypothetical protein